jgi:hypothetical protein
MVISPNKWELDVQGYLNTCNITATTPRQQIRDFAAGVNDLGLWNSMVCWPLRSSQNAGTGTTAYSLGGLGTFNGTLVNGPTWGADGIAFDGSDDYATANWPSITSEITVVAVHKVNSVSSGNRVIQFRGSQRGGLWSPFSDGSGYWDAINENQARTQGALGATANTFFSHIGVANSLGLNHWRNGTSLISTSTTPASFNYVPSVVELGRNETVATYQGTIAFVLLTQASSISASALHALYRNTLGTGLGLP